MSKSGQPMNQRLMSQCLKRRAQRARATACNTGRGFRVGSGLKLFHRQPQTSRTILHHGISGRHGQERIMSRALNRTGAQLLVCVDQIRLFRLFRDQIASFPFKKYGKLTVSRFLSFFRNARFAALQYIILQYITLASRRWRRQRFPGFPGNFPRVYGWGSGKAKG